MPAAITEQDILNVLDNSNDGYYRSFVWLGYVYSYLIDTRMNVFVACDDRWAIVIERLGYNPRAASISLDINYYGNCLTNLEYFNGRPTSNYSVYPIDHDSFDSTIDEEQLTPEAKYWLVRGQQLPLSHNTKDYVDAHVLSEIYEPDEITAEEVGRLVVSQNQQLFRATDKELYKSLPADMKKILVLDEWFHKDFQLQFSPTMTDEHLQQLYNSNKSLEQFAITFAEFAQSFRQQELMKDDWNRDMWEHNRPGSYETFQLIARVIVQKDPQQYKPTLKANTHWKNWTDSGSM